MQTDKIDFYPILPHIRLDILVLHKAGKVLVRGTQLTGNIHFTKIIKPTIAGDQQHNVEKFIM